MKALLPWASTTVSAARPVGLGDAALVVAACLVYREWPATDGGPPLGGARANGARLDLGVELVGARPGRRKVEADILLSSPDGSRRGVDVRFSRSGVCRATPSSATLRAIAEALERGELDSFHFVSPGCFRPAFRRAVSAVPGLHVHERVWPTEDDLRSIRLQELAAIDYGRVLREAAERVPDDPMAPLAELSTAAARAYRAATAGTRSLDEITTGSGFTYLFDSTLDAPLTEAPPRLVAGWGTTTASRRPRDRRFMRGFPLPSSPTPLDRGHLVARAAGGDEGIGLNLIPQDRRLNQGHGPQGRVWRRLEALAASHAGSRLFVRALYDDITDIPVRLDYVRTGPTSSSASTTGRPRPDGRSAVPRRRSAEAVRFACPAMRAASERGA